MTKRVSGAEGAESLEAVEVGVVLRVTVGYVVEGSEGVMELALDQTDGLSVFERRLNRLGLLVYGGVGSVFATRAVAQAAIKRADKYYNSVTDGLFVGARVGRVVGVGVRRG